MSVDDIEVPGLDLSIMDTRVDPAQDFHRYATGRYSGVGKVPPGYVEWGTFEEVEERTNAVLHQILEDCAGQVKSGEARAGSAHYLVGQFYASGMDQERINAEGANPLKSELDAIAQIENREQLASVLGHLHELGVKSLFNIAAAPDSGDNTRKVAFIWQGGLSLPGN
jgi:putative endopeptidase